MNGPAPAVDLCPRSRTIRVVIVDDDPDVRMLVRHKLARAGMEIAGEARDGAEAVEVVRDTQPDVVLLDLDMPRTSGDQALPHILQVASSTMVVVFSAAVLAEAGRQVLLDMGAFAYYDKADAYRLDALLRCDLVRFRGVLEGEDAVPRWLTDLGDGTLAAVPELASDRDDSTPAPPPGPER